MEKKVLVPLAEGFEIIEALSVVDVFKRAGAHVDLVALDDQLTVTSSHDIPVIADKSIADCLEEDYDLIVLPGGLPGSDNLANSRELASLLRRQDQAQKMYGAICAAPALVLGSQGLLEGRSATCHPMFTDKLSASQQLNDGVVVDGNCVTARGAGFSIDFSLQLLELLMGVEKRKEVETQMAMHP